MSFHDSLPNVLAHNDPAGFMRLIAELPAGVDVPKLLRYGFDHAGKNVSFVELCVAHRAAAVLEHVVQAAPGGVTLSDLSHFRPVAGWNDREEFRSLAHASVLGSYPAGLELALRLQPDSADLTRLLPYPMSATASSASLHFIALDQAVSKLDMVEHLRVQRQLALQLKAHGALLKVQTSAGVLAGGSAFFSRKWTDSVAQETAQLLRTYVQDGLVDVDMPLRLFSPNDGGMLPILLALRWGCAPMARELITLGCDLRKATDASAVCPGRDIDMLKLACTFSHSPSVEAALVSAVTEGLMQRRLSVLEEGMAKTDESNPNPISRRNLRNTL